MLCLFAMPSFTIISFFDSVLDLSSFGCGLWCDPTQLYCYKPRFAHWYRGRNWKMLVKRNEYIFGAAWTPKNTHHATRNVTDTAPGRTIIWIPASCMCCLEICISMSQSQFSTRKKQSWRFRREVIFLVFSWYMISPSPPTSGLTAGTAQRYESTWDQSLKYPPWGSLQIPQQWVIIQKKEILLYLITQENIIQS